MALISWLTDCNCLNSGLFLILPIANCIKNWFIHWYLNRKKWVDAHSALKHVESSHIFCLSSQFCKQPAVSWVETLHRSQTRARKRELALTFEAAWFTVYF
jgi:hypothetical protein